ERPPLVAGAWGALWDEAGLWRARRPRLLACGCLPGRQELPRPARRVGVVGDERPGGLDERPQLGRVERDEAGAEGGLGEGGEGAGGNGPAVLNSATPAGGARIRTGGQSRCNSTRRGFLKCLSFDTNHAHPSRTAYIRCFASSSSSPARRRPR